MRGYLTPDQVIAIYTAKGSLKVVAETFGTSMANVSRIRRGDRQAKITGEYRSPSALNATLVSMACGAEV